MIDRDSEGDESGSEIDELPLPAIALQHVDSSRLVVIIRYSIIMQGYHSYSYVD